MSDTTTSSDTTTRGTKKPPHPKRERIIIFSLFAVLAIIFLVARNAEKNQFYY